jgi:hypothetical protein
MQQAAGSLGVTLQIRDIQTADDLPAAFDAGSKEHAEGLIVTAESIFVVQRERVSELAARYRLAAMYPYTIQVAYAGGLMAYDHDLALCGSRLQKVRPDPGCTSPFPRRSPFGASFGHSQFARGRDEPLAIEYANRGLALPVRIHS